MGSDIILERAQRITVEQYHRMIEAEIFSEQDRLELLDGLLIQKMPHTPQHDVSIHLIADALNRMMPGGFTVRIQSSITLSRSEPEPDVVLAVGGLRSFFEHHPRATEVILVVEVAHATLLFDQTTKQEIYARDNLPHYWIVDVVNRCVEAYADPSGPTAEPLYRKKVVLSIDDEIPLEIAGHP